MPANSEITKKIKEEAIRLGFSACGIAQADYLKEEEEHLTSWLQNGYHAEMAYMANNKGKRVDPRLLLPGAKSVIVVLLYYFPEETQKGTDVPKIAKYAYGKDYHLILKDKLHHLYDYITRNIQSTAGRAFCDSAPILERAWAARAGLGWIGKNSQLINKDFGSFVFIGELIVNMELEYDQPLDNHCGNCTQCIDACPTGAIEEPGIVNAGKCISYLTIELIDDIPERFRGKMENCAFGCDICQDVCPWNKKAQLHHANELHPHPKLLSMKKKDWQDLNEEEYREIFKNTPVERIGYHGLKCNMEFLHSSGK